MAVKDNLPDQLDLIADAIKKRFDEIVVKKNNIDKVLLCAFVDGVTEFHRIERIASDDNPGRMISPSILKATVQAERDKYVLDPYDFQNTFSGGSYTYSVCPFESGFVVVFASATRDARLFSDAARKYWIELKPLIAELIEAL